MNAQHETDAGLNRAIKVLALLVLCTAVIVIALRFLAQVRTIATITIAAIFLCYAIFPAIHRLNKRMPFWAALAIVYFVLIALLATTLGFVLPALTHEVKQLVHDAPSLVQSAQSALSDPRNPVAAHLPPDVRNQLLNLPTQFDALVGRYGQAVAGKAIGIFASVIGIIALFIVVPIVALYMLLDKDAIKRNVLSAFPPDKQETLLSILAGVNGVVGGFIRGQLLVAAIVGVLITIMLTALHVRYALLIGCVAGILEIIPYLGAIVGAAPAVIIALITNGPLNAGLVIAGFVVINQVEGHIISPLVVGESVGLSPLFIILALLTGGELFGLPGLLLAVPVAGIIKVLLVHLVPRYAVRGVPPTQA